MYQQIQDLLDKIGPCPEKPNKPTLPAKHTAEMARAHAVNIEVFEAEFVEYDKARDTYLLNKGRIEHQVGELISRESGLFNLPEQYRDKIWSIAWKEGRSAGYHEVYQWLCKLVEIFE